MSKTPLCDAIESELIASRARISELEGIIQSMGEEVSQRNARIAALEAERDEIQAFLSDPIGRPYYDGTLLDQVRESKFEVERDRAALEADLEKSRAREWRHHDRAAALEAERDRLREALQQTQHRLLAFIGGCAEVVDCTADMEVIERGDAALAAGKEDTHAS